MKKGKVYLIGAGPGDPGLLTLKGRKCLATADVIIGDYLADRRLLRLARKDAEYIYVGKKAGHHTMSQPEISRLLVEEAEKGQIVARLKGGDPFVFGRGGEEIELLSSHGIPFEVIPGITSAIAAPAYAGIPVTHRKVAASFAVITGHEDPTKPESSIHWDKLATAVDTLVFLMGVGHAEKICRELMKYGRDPETPAAFIRWGTRPYQQTWVTTVFRAAEDIKKYGIEPPCVFIVGNVVKLRDTMRWFDNKPLFGQRVVITRSRTQASHMTEILEDLGAECIEIPAIRIDSPSDGYHGLDEAIRHLSRYQWIVFTSENGVRFFFERLSEKGLDSRALGSLKIACIGPSTAKALGPHGLKADCVPPKYKAEDLVESMKPLVQKGDQILIPRAKAAREILPDGLRSLGCHVDVAEAYRTVPDEENRDQLKNLLLHHEVDWMTFTSSSTVRNTISLLGGDISLLKEVKIACIGPITAKACEEAHLKPAVVSQVYTIEALADAMVKGVEKHEI